MRGEGRSSSWQEMLVTLVLTAVVGTCVVMPLSERLGLDLPMSAACSAAALWSASRRARFFLAINPRRAFALALGASAVASFNAIWCWSWHLDPAWVDSAHVLDGLNEGPPEWSMPALLYSFTALPLLIALTEHLATRLHRPLRVAVRALLLPAAVVLAALALAGFARRASHPAPASPIDRFPVVATFRAPELGAPVERHSLGAVTVSLACRAAPPRRCSVLLHRGPSEGLIASWQRNPFQGPGDMDPGVPVQVRHDARRDLWVIEALKPLHADPRRRHPRPEYVAAFRGRDLARVNLDLRDFPGDFAPPLGWPVAALFGLALAAWWIRRARFVAPLPGVPLLDATFSPDGALHLPDDTVLRGPHAAAFGPVVIAAPAPSPAPYRDAVVVPVLRDGTIAQWRAAIDHDRDVRAAFALSTLVLFSAPLVVAAYLRLLW